MLNFEETEKGMKLANKEKSNLTLLLTCKQKMVGVVRLSTLEQMICGLHLSHVRLLCII
jgi:hypothetical protein